MNELSLIGFKDEESEAMTVMEWFSIDTSIGHNVNPGEFILNRYRNPFFTTKVASGMLLDSSMLSFISFWSLFILPFPLINMLSALFLPTSQ